MLGWIPRGLRAGRVTTRYPRRAETPPPGYRGRVVLADGARGEDWLPGVCPTGAIALDHERRLTLDRGRCILCGACAVALGADRGRRGHARRGAVAAGAR
jgi:formate hydrogenlyase subunit 6/NADH:ubiquinone oxidoreductase subunit I